MSQNTVPRVACERNSFHLRNHAGVKKPAKKVLRTITEIVKGGGSATLVSICDYIHKQCTVRGANATLLVQSVRSSCKLAVKNGFLQADGKVFSLTDAGNELLDSCQSSSVKLLLDKLLAEKVTILAMSYMLCALLVDYYDICNVDHFT